MAAEVKDMGTECFELTSKILQRSSRDNLQIHEAGATSSSQLRMNPLLLPDQVQLRSSARV